MDTFTWLTKYSEITSYNIDQLSQAEVYAMYKQYCIENKIGYLKADKFGSRMVKLGFRRKSVRINGKVKKAWFRDLKPCTECPEPCRTCGGTKYVQAEKDVDRLIAIHNQEKQEKQKEFDNYQELMKDW